jgi:VanZ like family
MTNRQIKWSSALAYVGFIYATLNMVRAPISFLRRHNCLRLSLAILYVVCFGICLRLLRLKDPKNHIRAVILTGIFSLYYIAGRSIHLPEEEIHFFEYGLVGILFARAVSEHVQEKWKVFIFTMLLSTAAGWLDEIIQGFMPSRHYDIKDIFLNIASAAMGLAIFFTFPSSSEKSSPPS